jgi:hypothetical protein
MIMATKRALLLLCAFLVTTSAAAQEQRGAIEGIVRDTSGAVLPGVTIEGRSPRLIGVATAVSDAAGVFRLPALPPGIYEVTAVLQGFNPSKATGVELLLGQIKRVELTLTVGGVSETVQVTGESPLIDVKQSASSNNIRGEELQALPRGRDFTTLVAIAPGTNDEAKAAGISIDGASGAENRYVIDGIDTTNNQTGLTGKELVTDVIEEVQVKSSGYNAEYGGSTGGVVNVITRSGSDRWRGDAGTYFTSSGLQGPDRSILRLNLSDSSLAEHVTLPKDGFTQPEPAFTLGGPILKNDLWFFVSYIPRFTSTTRDVTFFSSGETVPFHLKTRVQNSANNITAQIARNTRVKFAFNLNPTHRSGLLPARDGSDDQALATEYFGNIDQDRPNTAYSGNLSYVASNQLLFSVRGGFLRTDINDHTPVSQVRHSFQYSNINMAGIPDEFRRPGGYSDVPQAGHSISQWDVQTRSSVNADVTYYATFAGSHTFKGGVQFDRTGNDVKSGVITPLVNLRWGRTRVTSDGQVVRGTYGVYSINQRVTTGDVHGNATALFVQDAWSINQRLTLNLGLRTEREALPSYDTSRGQADPALVFGFGQKIAPRVGFAWNITRNNRWKAYGSWGVFFDQTKLELARSAFGGTKSPNWYYTLDTYDWPSITCAGPPGPGCPGTFIEAYDGYLPSNLPDHYLVDRHIRPYRSWEATLGLDHELNRQTSIGFRYVHKEVQDAIEDLGTNVPGVGEDWFIANPGYGVAEYTLGPEYPAQPEAVRKYDGFEARIQRRLTGHLSFNANYLLSRLWGNYPGLASSDENGRSSPNELAIFDSLVGSFDQDRRPVFGRLGTDRPHQFKAQVIYQLPWGTTVSGRYHVANGRPISRQIGLVSGTSFYLGRMSDGRTPVYSQTDLYLQHEIRLRGDRRLQLSVNVMNLFDQATVTDRYNRETQDSLPITDEEFFLGAPVDVQHVIAETETVRDPRFLMDSEYQLPRAIRLGVKFVF